MKQWMLGLFSFWLMLTASVFAAEEFVEGQHYVTLPQSAHQQPVVQAFLEQNKGKIQVIEFFSYKCPGCFSFENIFSSWAKQQNTNEVAIRRMPVAFGPTWEPLAKTYFVLEERKEVERLNSVVFNAVHKDNLRLESQAEIAGFFSKHGIASADFDKAYQGFNVNMLWNQAQMLRQALNVTSIPAIVVNGQYLTDLGMAKNPIVLTQVVDYLIAKSKADK